MDRVGVPGGSSSYFRLSTRVVDQSLAALPSDDVLREQRRRMAVAGGYRITDHQPSQEQVTLVGVGAMMTEVLEAAHLLEAKGITAGVVCLTSPDLLFRSFQARGSGSESTASDIAQRLFPSAHATPIVTVMDGHPHTLAFLAGLRGDRIRCLGVTEFGQSSNLADAYALHGIDSCAILDAAMSVLGR
jgi:pyruvate dehydrogenase E1 component